MKTVVTSLLSGLLILFVFLALPIQGEEAIYENIVRLHVLPSSDSAEDQNLKILVRDAILEEYGDELSSFRSKEEAEQYLEAHLADIDTFVRAFLTAQSYDRTVTVSLEEEYFETRVYGEITLPAGNYSSLTIRLGEGEGQNWWCVLYPSLCTEAALGERVDIAEENLSEAEYKLVTGSGYRLKFRTLEILEAVIG